MVNMAGQQLDLEISGLFQPSQFYDSMRSAKNHPKSSDLVGLTPQGTGLFQGNLGAAALGHSNEMGRELP